MSQFYARIQTACLFLVLSLAAVPSFAGSGETQISPLSLIQGSNRPSVRFSDVWCRENNATLVGYFDVMFFNSVVPLGSRVFMHYGYERARYNPASGTYERDGTWLDRSRVELKQWEEYGWFTRVSRVITHRQSRMTVSALNLYLEIETPDGMTLFIRGGSSDRHYFRGPIPDMRTCEDLGHEALKICSVSLEVASSKWH